jgi:large subunit ribosomal protein L4
MSTEIVDAPVVERRSSTGEVLSVQPLDPQIFAVQVNVPLVHQVVTAQLAARRSGTQSTKTRAEVRGGGAKPYRQKGTGRARQGSVRAPHFSGGGVAFGPKPRSYAQRTPKKMVQAALRCALSDRASEGAIRLVNHFDFTVPKTKDAVAVLDALSCQGKVLVVVNRDAETALRSFANLPLVISLPADQLSAYDVVSADVVLFTDDTLPGGEGYRVPADAPNPVVTPKSSTEAAAPKAPAAKRTAARRAAAAAVETEPVVDEPVVDEPAAAAPVVDDTTTDTPAPAPAAEPIAAEAAADEPVADEPVAPTDEQAAEEGEA